MVRSLVQIQAELLTVERNLARFPADGPPEGTDWATPRSVGWRLEPGSHLALRYGRHLSRGGRVEAPVAAHARKAETLRYTPPAST